MPIELETEEEKQATKVVRDLSKKFRESRTTLELIARQMRAPKITAKLGQLNLNILLSGERFEPRFDVFLNLPPELQNMIWDELTCPADRIALALSCKPHALTFERLRCLGSNHRSTTKPAKPAANANTVAGSSQPRPRVLTKTNRIRVLHRLQEWMGESYKLCYECVRFRPKVTGDRSMIAAAFFDNRNWSGRTFPLVKGDMEPMGAKELKKAMREGSRCPHCNTRTHNNTIVHKKEHKQLKKELAALL